MKLLLRSFVATVAVMLLIPCAAAAESYNSYTYNFWQEAVPSPEYYKADCMITGDTLDTTSLAQPSDVAVYRDYAYITDTGNNRIVVIDSNFKLVKIIDGFDNNGERDSLLNPKGAFVNENGIYIADTDNNRVVRLDSDGNLLKLFGRPETDLLDSGVPYKPAKIAVDTSGRMYIQAVSVNSGLLEIDSDGSFLGFYGANKVTVNISDYIWKIFSTKAQKETTALYLPTEYTNLTIDEENFVYVTSNSSKDDLLKRLNPGGNDVLIRNGYVAPIGDYQFGKSISSFIDVTVSDSGIYSVLDSNAGRIFTYNGDGDLLVAFGGKGNMKGNLQLPVAISYFGNYILVADNVLNAVVAYDLTEYGLNIQQALEHYEYGRYEESRQSWEKVLKYNSNADLAYIGLGKISLQNENYEEAINYFKLSQNRNYYSKAYKMYRKEKLATYLPYVIVLIILIAVVLIFVSVRGKIKLKIKRWCVGYEKK